MVKLNRIGNKLGAVGLLGVVLAGGMVVNQMASERAINAANERARVQQAVTDHVLEGDIALRRMQLAVQEIRLSLNPSDVHKSVGALKDAFAAETRELDAAIADGVTADDKQRLQSIKTLTVEYFGHASDVGSTQLRIFEITAKRHGLTGNWIKAFEALMLSPLLMGAANRSEIEKVLNEADSMFNAVRAATWRLIATGDESQTQEIARRTDALNDTLDGARSIVSDMKMLEAINSLAAIVKGFSTATAEALKTEAVKKMLVELQTVPAANQAQELMRTAVDVAKKNTEQAKSLATSALNEASRLSFVLAIIVMLSLIGSVAFSFVGVARPLTRLNGALGRMAAGELNIRIPGAKRGDEVGDLAKTVLIISRRAEEKARQEGEARIEQDQIAARQRRAEMHRLADGFEAAVGEIVETVSSSSTELEASATTLTRAAERAQQLTTMVAAASEEASSNVQSVSSATEQMASSVNEIGRQVEASARMANEAVDQARRTNERVSELSMAAARIGDVVELINSIAGQTNLLALNATIEAARAGSAGRGFAVVASEVKALAEQTAKATGEIGQQISGIQAAMGESVGAIKAISATIERLSEISTTIAAAVEQQGAATQEISRNVQQAAHGTHEVSSNISAVQRGASETGSASSQLLSAAQSLSSDSNRLKLEVGKFLNTVRAA